MAGNAHLTSRGRGGLGRSGGAPTTKIHLAAGTPQPARAALQAGWAWGRYLAERPPFRRDTRRPTPAHDADHPTRRVTRGNASGPAGR